MIGPEGLNPVDPAKFAEEEETPLTETKLPGEGETEDGVTPDDMEKMDEAA